jgi:hypothetical protein
MQVMRRVLPLLLLLLMAACAERWERPGVSEAEADAVNEGCAAQAQLAVPPNFVWQIVAPARMERERQCWREGNQERCRVFDRFVPARWGHVDVNQQPRAGWRFNCMQEKGFTFRGYRPLRLE